MTLSEHAQLNTVAEWFDVQFRYFSGPNYGMMVKDGIIATLEPWTSPDSPLSNWTEITDRLAFASRFTQTLQGSSIVWSAELSGWNYEDTLLGLGLSLVCWRRFWRSTGTGSAPAGWQPWELHFVGEIVSRNDRNNYQNGKPWQREVTGANFHLSGINAPRVTAGRIRVTEGASLTGNEPLATIEAERDTGEFVGGRANVDLANMVDGNRNTVYISETIPTGAAVPFPNGYWDGGIVIMEIFFKPFPGWSVERSWWVEVYNQRTQSHQMGVNFVTATWENGQPIYRDGGGGWPMLTSGHCAIFCGHRKTFDELTGGDNNGAEWIADISQTSQAKLSDDAAIVVGGQIVAWSPGGVWRDYVFRFDTYTVEHHGLTFNSDLCGNGQSIYNAGSWIVNPYPHPGANGTGEGPVWFKVLLPENICQTLDEVSATNTSIRLDNYRAWMVNKETLAPSYGVVNGCVFSWRSRDANGLHGVIWQNAPAAPIPPNTRCYPYVNGIAQTGYPLTATHLVRRKFPTVESYRVYWSQYVARDYTESGWQTDYYEQFHTVQGNTQRLRLTNWLGDGVRGLSGNNYLWVRSILYLIDRMTDGGRTKINEFEADISQTALDLGGTVSLDGQNSSALARYLVADWAGIAESDFIDESFDGAHFMGQHALAITPVDRVLDDLARATGCLVDFAPVGGVVWREDPWWPKNSVAPAVEWAFDGNSYRGDVEVSQVPAQVDFVILNALSLEGDPHSLRVVYPTPLGTTEPPVWAMVREVNDRIVALDSDASLVAQVELEKLVLSNRGARLTVKGPGEWARPGMRIGLYHDYSGAGLYGPNLITNGGFETHSGTVDDGVSDSFTGWNTANINDSVGRKIEATVTAHGTGRAAKLITPNDPVWLNQSFAVTLGATYRLAFWTRGDGAHTGYYGVFDNSNGVNIIPNQPIGITGVEWQLFATQFDAPVGCVSVALGLLNFGGTIFFDDVSLQPLTGAQYRTWLIQSVNTVAGESNGQRTYQTDLELAAFRG